jgi:excisionase family DNA binding protein
MIVPSRMPYSVAEAAQRLGVNRERVRAMIAAGQLRARKFAGRWLIDESSVDELLARPRPVGRPFSVRRSWGLLMLASGRLPDWLSPPDVSRLRRVLRERSLEELAPRLEGRATKHVYRAHPSDLTRIPAAGAVLLAGASGAGEYRLDLVSEGELDVYGEAGHLEELTHRFALRESDRPNLTLRAVTEIWPFHSGERVVPPAVIGIDLLASVEPRFQRAGKQLLERLASDD